MAMFMKDAAFAARTLRKNPAFTLTAIITLALGIGATTAIFSVVNAVLLRSLPYDHPERLTIIWGELRTRQVYDWMFAPGDLKDLMDQATLFDGIAALRTNPAPKTGGRAHGGMRSTNSNTRIQPNCGTGGRGPNRSSTNCLRATHTGHASSWRSMSWRCLSSASAPRGYGS